MNEERFVITNYNNEVSVLDTDHEFVEEEGNLLLLSFDYNYSSDAEYAEEELKNIVRILNDKNKRESIVYEYFKNYLNEIRDEIPNEVYNEMYKTIKLLSD